MNITLLTSGRLNNYLADIDREASEMFDRIVTQLTEREDITEQLKTKNQLLWIGKMSEI